ncbi:MAG: amidohydrolase family protein [Armatimonadetes bacterium]|nr:amidohydrolase family protein [Armatimonadota bacterium]
MPPVIIDVNTCFGFLPHKRADMSLERLTQWIEGRGIVQALTISTQGIFEDCSAGNRLTASVCSQNSRFVPVGTLDPRKLTNPQAEIDRCRQEGIRFFKFYPDLQGWPLESPVFEAALEGLAARKNPIIISATAPGMVSRMRPKLSDYPGPVILSSGGMDSFAEILWAARDLPHVSIDIHRLTAPDALLNACGVLGAGRVLFGSGAPESTLLGAMLSVYRTGLSEEDRNAVLNGNALRLLEGN